MTREQVLEFVRMRSRIEDLEKQNAELAKALGVMVSRDAAMVPLQQLLMTTSDPKGVISLMYHDEDCGRLLDAEGWCSACLYYPDMQDCAFRDVATKQVDAARAAGGTFLGRGREEIR